MNLYRKIRPQSFDEMIGNEAEIESLKKALHKSHAFLLSGNSGCGKTTLARIAAKQLGADELSIIEINAADNRGIDTAREVIEQMKYPAISGNKTVYIFDECQQFSKDMSSALLKPLEDTPEHIYFFLCTTEPEKILKAIQTRCTHIRLSAQEPETLLRFLYRTSKNENLEVPKDVLREIAENSSGSPRQAVVLLEKIAEMDCPEKMRSAVSMGTDASNQAIDLCRSLLQTGKNWSAVSGILTGLRNEDPEKIRRAVLGYANAVLLKTNNPRAAVMLECMAEPLYNSGFPGLTLACYKVLFGE